VFRRNKKEQKENKMSSEQYTDYSCLSRALWWAKKNGYKVPPLEQAVFDTNGGEPLRQSLRRWAQGMLFDHDFAKAVFGYEEVDDYGHDFKALRFWAKQVAIKHMDKLYQVKGDEYQVVMLNQPKVADILKITDNMPADVTLEAPERVVYGIRNLAASIPFNTHKLQDVEVTGGTPSWQYHIKQMAISENPFVYINDYIDEALQKQKPNVV
jgi:hypothetical protein